MDGVEAGVAVVGAPLGVKLREVVNILLSEAASVVNRRDGSVQGEASVLRSALLVAGLCSLALGVVSGVAFHGCVLWVELTGGIVGVLVSRRLTEVDAVLQHQPSEITSVGNLPHRIPVGFKHQLVAHRIEGDAPVAAVGVIGVAERAEEVGVIAMSIFVLVADRNRLNAINVNFHGLNLRVGLLNEMEIVRGRTIRQDKMLHAVKSIS